MKKLISILLAATMILSLAACGSDSGGTTDAATTASDAGIQGPDDLTGKSIGVQEGTTGDQLTTDDFGEDSVIRYKTGFEAVQALLTGKIDAVIIDDQVAQSFVEANEGLKILDAAYTDEDYALYINMEETELLDKVNAAIEEIKSNGVMDDIIAYYISGDESAAAYHEQTLTEFPNGTLDVAVNAKFPPYEYYEGEDIWGIDADMLRAIGDILGMEVKFSDMEFSASLAAVQTGKSKIAMGAITANEERAQSGNFSDVYYTGKQVIIVPAE